MKYTNYKLCYKSICNSKLVFIDCNNIINKTTFCKIKNSYLLTNSIGEDFYSYNSFSILFNDIWKVLTKEKNLGTYSGDTNFLTYEKNTLEIENLFLNDSETEYDICTIEIIEFMKLSLIWAEANYYLQKKLKINWDVPMEWIETQWKLIKKYEENINE